MFCRGLWDKCFAGDLFVEERYNIFRIIDTYKILFICILLKHHYIPHINNLLLIPDWFVRHMMTCLRRHYWLHDVFTCHHWLSYELNKQKLSSKPQKENVRIWRRQYFEGIQNIYFWWKLTETMRENCKYVWGNLLSIIWAISFKRYKIFFCV